MEFSELIEKRYSVRAYKPDPVEEDKLNRVLEAIRLAPTAADRQPFQLVIIHTKGREKDLQRIYNRDWFVQAPLVIAACGVPSQGWIHQNGKNHYEIDVTIAMDHLIMAATNEGLGTCWIAAFDVDAAREVLKLPEGVVPVFFTPLGHPDDVRGVKVRKPLSDMVQYEYWKHHLPTEAQD